MGDAMDVAAGRKARGGWPHPDEGAAGASGNSIMSKLVEGGADAGGSMAAGSGGVGGPENGNGGAKRIRFAPPPVCNCANLPAGKDWVNRSRQRFHAVDTCVAAHPNIRKDDHDIKTMQIVAM